MLGRLFTDHPKTLGMSWAGHAVGAVKIGGETITTISIAFGANWPTRGEVTVWLFDDPDDDRLGRLHGTLDPRPQR